MVESNWRESVGISVSKIFGEELIAYLKDNQLLSIQLKIINKDDLLIIPITETIDLELIKSKINLGTQLNLVQENFELRNKRAGSIAEALKGKIPTELIKFQPVAFDQIGSIAVVELKDEILEYKELIGKAIIEFNPSVSTVFRKSKAVSGVTRLRGLQLIAGLEEYETIHKEYGIKIFVNIRNIYFSPRLSTEHRRIAEQVKPDETVLDMFGAAAPFALHIASLQHAIIYTVDINEFANPIISQSINLNPKLKGKINIFTGDAKSISKQFIEENLLFDRIIMNHPSGAKEFIHTADKLVKRGGVIHFYSFIDIEDHDNLCQKIIKQEIQGYVITDITKVRQYSPHEHHTCITIKKL